jgi:hypothetical protein
MSVDLHTHSVYSDGTLTPAELIQAAKQSGLHAISLTDHDTIDGIDELLIHGRNACLQVISGLEVSSMHKETSIHILGYGIDHRRETLHKKLSLLQQGRKERNLKIICKLQNLGLNISIEELAEYSRCGQAGRPHIAGLLLQKGVVKTMDFAFKYYLRKGAPAYAERFAFSAAETIDMIHMAGGLAILAHPGHIDADMKKQPLLIGELTKIGLDGLEAYYPAHSNKMKKQLIDLAQKHQLLVTGGSDFHGENKPNRKLACNGKDFCPPDSLYLRLLERLQQYTDLNTLSSAETV